MFSVLNLTVLVAGFGYFVDLFDITLFGVARVASLTEITGNPAEVLSQGVFIYNMGMLGMMIGGLLWGILADRRGRLSVMFASILIYSLANIANAFVHDVNMYALCRFIGGLGLAGELGSAITLVAESLPKEKRGLGTTIVATLGMLGILAAAIVGQAVPWRIAYAIGGVLGLILLLARFKLSESSMFHKEAGSKNRGNVFLLFREGRWFKYLCCVAIGFPIYFTTGVLFTFAPELTAGLGVQGKVSAGNAILYGSIGLTIGDLLSGLLSQKLKSRRKAVGLSLVTGFALLLVYCFAQGLSVDVVYLLSGVIGMTVGYWAVLVTMAAEQFGTNIRGTVATTVPNFVRGSGILATSAFAFLKVSMGAAHAVLAVGSVAFSLALLALWKLDETFYRNLDYHE